ncbi:DUF6850 family outer membrane beta-barrel protein [Pedobacter punctiformis]|uniref:DUF6850 domain-containing protein n=1 Tax=Pedobacter punctiformis TaxID=3004097 RepID=A0ABT4LES4_9SPHI|nr:DUF6850 family outer membrane beta-barrel protein [Pedobacter sp. HCMS5-2]MCZ4245673.1 hypothetical protein [Pedobacter sp. HCMS5-2]
MRKLIIISIVIILSIFKVFAQTNEKAFRTQSLVSKSYSVDSALTQLYQFSKENPFFMEKMMPNKYNNLTVRYDFDKGHYIPVQGASKVQSLSLFSEGKTTLEKFHLYGSFNYQRSTEDSTRWAHQSRFSNSSPYYFGSIKNNHYERSVYKINAAVSRAMIADNLPLSLAIDYRIGNHFSNNDPRGDVRDFQLNINPAIGYNLSDKLLVGVGYQYGYGREQIGVGYKNSSYFENTVSEIFTNYLIKGYGSAQIVQVKNLLRYDNNQDRQYAKAYVNYSITTDDNILLTLKKGNESQLFKRNFTDDVGFSEFMTYDIKHSSANLVWHKNTERSEVNLSVNYNYNAGAGYDNELAGINYINDQESYGLKLFYTLKNKNGLVHNLNFGVQHLEDIKKDGNYAVDISCSRVNFNAGWGINKQLSNNHSFGAAISAVYSLKTSSSFFARTENENVFYNYVIYPDYQFNTSNNYALGLSADYSFPTYKGIQTSIKVSGNYIQHVGNYVDLQRTTLNTPGKDRFSSNISLNLYF